MAPTKQSIPGTTIFDGEQAQKGYALNKMCMSFNDAASRAEFLRDEGAYYFFRRTNMNAAGQARSWTDHLLWHHAAHTVDLFQYQTGEQVQVANAVQGPVHPELGIAMDMSIQLRTASDKILTLSLSFNNDGPLGSFFRYICDNGTYIARYDDLVDGYEKPIDVSAVAVSANGIELEDREFVAAIRAGREPQSGIADVLPCYQVLDQLEQQLLIQR